MHGSRAFPCLYGLQFVRTQLHLVGLRSEIAERALINLVSFARVINPINRVNAQPAKNIKGCFSDRPLQPR